MATVFKAYLVPAAQADRESLLRIIQACSTTDRLAALERLVTSGRVTVSQLVPCLPTLFQPRRTP